MIGCTERDVEMSNPQARRSLFKYVMVIVVPAAAAIATIFQQQRAVALGLIIIALLSLLISLAPTITKCIEIRKANKKERAICEGAFEDLRNYAHKFEEFSNTGRADTLYFIIFGKLCQSNQAAFDSLHLVPPMLFADLFQVLRNRTDRKIPNLNVLRESILEFNTIIANFCRYLACPACRINPSKLTAEMQRSYQQQNVQADLIQFRERIDRFLDDYMDFLKKLDRKLPSPLNFAYHFERPQPLPVTTMV